jgi:hypothetical protein
MSRIRIACFLIVAAALGSVAARAQGGGADFTRFVGVGPGRPPLVKLQKEDGTILSANLARAQIYEERSGKWTLVPRQELRSEFTKGRGLLIMAGPANRRGVVVVRKGWFDTHSMPKGSS